MFKKNETNLRSLWDKTIAPNYLNKGINPVIVSGKPQHPGIKNKNENWVCLKDDFGKYMINTELFSEIACFKGRDDENYILHLRGLYGVKDRVFEYKNYEDASSAYDYIKNQLIKNNE